MRPARTGSDGRYGPAHRAAKREALKKLKDGDLCARCRGPMFRSQSKVLDLDHNDDGIGYRGLAHRRCNRSAGAKRGNKLRGQRRRGIEPSRGEWRSRDW